MNVHDEDGPSKAEPVRGRKRPSKPRQAEQDWDIVDETSDESFPASDPPGWIGDRPRDRE